MANKPSALVLSARAKINTHLYVGPRRADGYHSIDTIFQEISLQDTLTFRLTPQRISLSVRGAKLTAGPDNLIVRALEMLRKEMKIDSGMAVSLNKKIPMGAGLGGGSSDAAAALKAGWKLWGSRKGASPLLFKCAKKLGADVSFFLMGGRARARGIGEKLISLPSQKKKWLVLVYPRVHVSTPLAYRWLDESRHPGTLLAGVQVLVKTWVPAKKHAGTTFNDFESVVLPRFPTIRRVKEELRRLGCQEVTMSGSGSSVFGFVTSKSIGEKVKRSLRTKAWDVFVVHTV